MRKWPLTAALAAVMLASPARAETSPAAAPVVTRVDYAGDVIDPARMRELTSLKPGMPYSPLEVRKTLDILYQKGLYRDILVETQSSPGGVAVTFRFVRQLLITSWQFKGNDHLNNQTLTRLLELTWGQPLNERHFDLYARRIHERYQREGFLQAQASFQVYSTAQGQVRLVVNVNEGAPMKVRDIRILSTGPLSEREVVRALGVHAGDRLTREQAYKGLENIESALSDKAYLNSRLTHFFQLPDGKRITNFSDLVSANPSQVDLVLAVEQGQKALVAVDGDVLLPEEKLARAITVYQDRSYSPAELDDSAEKLRKLYVANGYPDAKVTHTVEKLPDGGYRINFHVLAGTRVEVAAIRFIGNRTFSDKTLQPIFNTQPASFFNPGVFDPEVWQTDLENVVAYYQSQGFLQAHVAGTDRELSPAGNKLTLLVHMDEGPRSVVSRILFKGASHAQEAGLLQGLPINPGDPYDPRHLADYISSVEAYYARTGYPLARVKGRFEEAQGPEEGALIFTVEPGVRKRLGAIVVRGNVKTHDDVVRRQFTVKPGELFNSEELLRTQQQIYQLGFFDRVDVTPLKPISAVASEPVDLVVVMHERETGSVSVGGGYGDIQSAQGPQVSAEYLQNNLGGTGRPLRVDGALSLKRTNGLASLRDPYLLGHDLIGEAGVSYLRDRLLGTNLLYQTYGPTLGISRQLTRAILGSLRYSWSHTNYLEYTQEELDKQGGVPNRTDSIVSLGLTYDTRSDILDPHWGTRTDLAADFALPVLGGSLLYTRPHLTVGHYIPLPRHWTLALGADLGYIRPLAQYKLLPKDILFQLGEGNLIRGYQFDAANAQLGEVLGIGHVELRFPVWGPLGAAVFVDAGNAWATASDVGVGNLKLTSGLGVRYQTPIGPVRLDYGFHVRPELGFSGLAGFSFGLGQAF